MLAIAPHWAQCPCTARALRAQHGAAGRAWESRRKMPQGSRTRDEILLPEMVIGYVLKNSRGNRSHVLPED